MKKYSLFSKSDQYAYTKDSDFVADFDTVDEAKEAAELHVKDRAWVQITESENMRLIMRAYIAVNFKYSTVWRCLGMECVG